MSTTRLYVVSVLVALCGCGDDGGRMDGGAPGSGDDARVDLSSCSVSTDCVLRNRMEVEEGCGYSRDNVEAVNDRDAPYANDPSVGSQPCMPWIMDTRLVADCVDGRCRVRDFLEEPATACEMDADCALYEVGCGCRELEPGMHSPDPVPLNRARASDYVAVVCGEGTAPEDCELDEAGHCGEDGRCRRHPD